MKRRAWWKNFFGLCFLLMMSGLAGADELLPQHREWLENVSPIMTRAEREIFLKLKTDGEREKFIRFFWRQRDPLPETEENEFYREYMERVRFADQNFGHGTSKRGSQTERGFYYLLLGPPLERQFFTTHSQLWPLELWQYKGEIEYGLPPYFYLIFYQPGGLGEYRLYSPGVEGPERLIVPGASPRSLTRSAAYQLIKRISSELASASLSYIPGEATLLAPSFSSASLLASLRSVPEKKFSDAYARSYLNYKDYIEIEYSHAYIESEFGAKVFWHDGGFFLHWTIEPKKVSLVEREGRFRANYSLILRLEDREGNLVLEKEEEIPLSITAEQARQHSQRTFAIQDILPVIPGHFRLFGLLKNKTTAEFTSFGGDFFVPEKRPAFGPLLLYHSQEKVRGAASPSLQAFTLDGTHYLVSAASEFTAKEELGIYLQASWPDDTALGPSAALLIEVRPAGQEEPALRQKRNISDLEYIGSYGIDLGGFSLASIKPGYYEIEVALIEDGGKKTFTARENFVLFSRPQAALPWVYARVHGPAHSAEHLSLLASQYFMMKKYEDAVRLAEQAFKSKEEPPTRLLFARCLYGLDRFPEAIETVFPLQEDQRWSREAVKVIAASYAGLKDWAKALLYLEKLMAEATETGVLNLAAECYLNLDNPGKAVPLLRRSLEIDPSQPAVRALLEETEKRVKK